MEKWLGATKLYIFLRLYFSTGLTVSNIRGMGEVLLTGVWLVTTEAFLRMCYWWAGGYGLRVLMSLMSLNVSKGVACNFAISIIA